MIWYVIWHMIWYGVIWYDIYDMIYDMTRHDKIWCDIIYLLTAVGLTPGGNSTVHVYTQTVHRTAQSTQTKHRTTHLHNTSQIQPTLYKTTAALIYFNLS